MPIPRRRWLLAAAGLAAVLVAAVGLTALLAGDGDSVSLMPAWGCTDPSICSKWSLLRTSKHQRQGGPDGAGSAPHAPQPSAARRRHGRQEDSGGGGSHSLITAPLDAAARIFRRVARGSRKQQQRAAPPLFGHPSHEAGLDLRKGSTIHVDTSHGRLPLIVDSAPDAEGDVSVHGFREGLRYEGSRSSLENFLRLVHPKCLT